MIPLEDIIKLYETKHKAIQYAARHRGLSREDAEDVTQGVFVDVIRRRHTINLEFTLYTYVCKAVKWAIKDRRKLLASRRTHHVPEFLKLSIPDNQPIVLTAIIAKQTLERVDKLGLSAIEQAALAKFIKADMRKGFYKVATHGEVCALTRVRRKLRKAMYGQ